MRRFVVFASLAPALVVIAVACGGGGAEATPKVASNDSSTERTAAIPACSASARKCNGAVPQTCQAGGRWRSEASCAQPTPQCEDGACVCSGVSCNGRCVDSLRDADNCGTCGASCRGGLCKGGACQPVTLASGVVLGAAALALNATSVYFSGKDGLMKVPLAGGAVTTVVPNTRATRIALDATSVYWTSSSDGVVMKVPIAGGAPTVIASNQANPHGIAVDANNVYWTTTNTVSKIPLGGGMPTDIASNQSTWGGIALDANNVYWTTGTSSSGRVMKASLRGGKPVELASAETPQDILVDGTSVYWGDRNGAGVFGVPIAGGKASPLGIGQIYNIALSDGFLYWTSGGARTIYKAPTTGGKPTKIASGLGDVQGIAVDATSIYWIDVEEHSLMKLAK